MGTIDAEVPITNSGLPHSTHRLTAILAFEGLPEAQQHRKESEQGNEDEEGGNHCISLRQWRPP